MARCYFPGCESHANTKEHIPPKSFFPDLKKMNLMTVKSCKIHNNEKTKDDIYALANISLNCIADDKSDAFEIFEQRVKPQLLYNNEALLKKVLKNLSRHNKSMQKFEVDTERLDGFFDCLTHGVIYKKTKKKINLENYSLNHLYMNLDDLDESGNQIQGFSDMKDYWTKNLLNSTLITETIEFKVENPKGYSDEIYTVRFMGADFIKSLESENFNSSITVIHKFYGHFSVISLLTRTASFDNTPIHLSPTST